MKRVKGFLETNQATIYACYLGYIVQGIINNINPILFVTYQKRLGISLEMISLLIIMNFGFQILVDLVAAKYVDRIGHRLCMVMAHVCTVLGLFAIGLLPAVLPNPVPALIIGTVLNGMGGGLLEVLVSPIVEAVPGDEKEKAMSLLHSFYCWGCVGFIALSTLLLRMLGSENWFYLPLIWAVLPFINIVAFSKVPILRLVEEDEQLPVRKLFGMKMFWLLVILMLCAGASEMGMSQWASYFAEIGLKVDKTAGDLLGPCFFCILMGIVRTYYGRSEGTMNLHKFIKGSCLLCIVSYLIAVFAPHPVLGLFGCGLCGLSIAILWPGTFSIAARSCKAGGTVLFALLALAGDIGCATGPQLVSMVSGLAPEYGLKAGLLAAIVFPLVLLVTLGVLEKEEVKV
ncbi:MAG: MFS transporter [Lachnospiraceae bacterium]|nr:MFS transporter [Lachnospiraceae bacterium]